jgi:LacI family transcriptional regulator
MPVTIQDLAHQLNLSKGTVSRVLNRRNDALISQATRDRVIEAARDLGYRPNRAARSLATGRTDTVAFYTHQLTSISSAVINHMQPLGRRRDLDMIVHTFDRGSNPNEQVILAGMQVDGVLAYEPHEYIHLIVDLPGGERPPLVSMGTYLIEDTDFVGINLIPPIIEAVRHLIKVGCRNIVYVEDAGLREGADFRLQTYERVILEAGLRPDVVQVPGGTRARARQTIRDYVRTGAAPDGVLCRYDDLAIGVYRGLRDLGLRIPEDVAIVGCDGIEDTEYLDAPLTTIVQPIDEMCDLAWDLLERRMEAPDTELEQIILPARLEIRASSNR